SGTPPPQRRVRAREVMKQSTTTTDSAAKTHAGALPGRAPSHPPAPKPGPSRNTTPSREPAAGYVAVGRVLAPFGLKGELKVQSLTDNDERFAPKSRLWADSQPVTVAKSRTAGGHMYVTLKGFADRTSVERFAGALLQVPESMLPALEEGEHYRFQLIGLTVVTRDGTTLGTLEEIIE